MRACTALLPMVLLSACVFDHGRASSLLGRAGVYGRSGVVAARPNASRSATFDYRGELLEVQDSALLVQWNRQILLIPFGVIRSVRFGDLRGSNVASIAAMLRRAARYPHGLTEDQWRELLAAYAQDAFNVVGRAGTNPVPMATELNHSASQHDVTTSFDSTEPFFATARSAATPYLRLENAVAAGYRRIGPSFPGMGEHWIHPGLIVAGDVRPDRPPVLCYVRIAGEPRLIAVAFTVPLLAGDTPPSAPFGPDVWHDHSGGVDEESLLLTHPGSHTGATGSRLAMFHTWLWLDNPAGPLAQNNWRLPFLVAGVNAGGVQPSVDAARGLSLWTTEPDYYAALFDAAARLSSEERIALRRALDAQRAHIGAWVAHARSANKLESTDLAELEEFWSSLWTDIGSIVRTETLDQLRFLR